MDFRGASLQLTDPSSGAEHHRRKDRNGGRQEGDNGKL